MGEEEGGVVFFDKQSMAVRQEVTDGLTEEYILVSSYDEPIGVLGGTCHCIIPHNTSVILLLLPKNLDGGFNRRESIYPETQVLNVLKEDSFLPSSKSVTSRTTIP